ncbi:MAG: nucleotidyltransferase domain-containing protein [Acidimicrobiia bacterium]|nr:nucleotidyltransferase domain-containing protein [Acidimicrobiia bacterium]
MNTSHPISDVIPSSEGQVLLVLAGATDGLSARAVARLTAGRVSHVQASKVLRRLARAGVVIEESRPPALAFRLNRDHVSAPAIEQLATLRQRLLQRIGSWTEAAVPAPDAVWAFGSFARGDGGSQSDIDLLVIRPPAVPVGDGDWECRLAELASAVRSWSGNPCSVVEYSMEEYAALLDAGERLPLDVARDGIRVAGLHIPRAPVPLTGR